MKSVFKNKKFSTVNFFNTRAGTPHFNDSFEKAF